MKQTLFVLLGIFLLAACGGLEQGSFNKTKHGNSLMAISNSGGEEGLLRTGRSLNIAIDKDLLLRPNTNYMVVVTNLSTNKELARADLLSDMDGRIELSTVAHDVGEYDGVQERDTLSVKVTHPDSGVLVEDDVPMMPSLPKFEAHGFQIDEVQPPHIFSADSTGRPQNAFVVGGPPDPGEVAGPIYAAGKGFPTGVEAVDLYIVKDGDRWRNARMPQPGDASYVAGPVLGKLQDGTLTPTNLGWVPESKHVGIYDILVDVDRNGTFDYSFSAKDGADGEEKVGFTIQYGAAWLRLKTAMTGKHLLVNLAYTSKSRSGGTWSNSYSESAKIYSYVNPPVQKGSRHGFVQKLLVAHQDWSKFWNNPDKMIQGGPGGFGRIPISDHVVQGTGGTPQQGCTNSPPVTLVNPGALGQNPQAGGQNGQRRKFDVVFDYGKDGYYDIGLDFLDVVSTRTDGALLTAEDLKGIPDDQIFGLEIR
jgi:hypothetical protein